MIDVFLSYTTRGLTDDSWIKSFQQDLIRFYRSSYSKELKVWLAPIENVVGDNFRSKISDALKQTAILMLILEPEYLNSPETLKEVEDYSELRDNNQDIKHFIKVIVFRGSRGSELQSFISSDILSLDFFTLSADDNQVQFERGDTNYKNAIQNINKAIRQRQLEYCRKINAQKILDQLPRLGTFPKIYVGLSYSSAQDRLQRNRFIQQLKETINRNSGMKNVLILPDELTTMEISYEDLEEIFFDDNVYGKQCIDALIDASNAVILRIINDNLSEASDTITRISQQSESIHREEILNNKLITILADVPKELYAVSKFFERWDNPIYATKQNFKLIKDRDIDAFIESYLNILKPIIGIEPPEITVDPVIQKHIFIIEPFNESPKDDSEKLKLEQEAENKRKFIQKIKDQGFILIPGFPSTANLTDAARYNQRYLGMSDGVIIYYGVFKDRIWCLQQQSEIFGEIDSLNQIKPRKIEKAVYLDPLQQNREPTNYFYFNYDVITTDPPELDQFLNKI